MGIVDSQHMARTYYVNLPNFMTWIIRYEVKCVFTVIYNLLLKTVKTYC
jgi:hypothetical protein